jgi:adenylate kinase
MVRVFLNDVNGFCCRNLGPQIIAAFTEEDDEGKKQCSAEIIGTVAENGKRPKWCSEFIKLGDDKAIKKAILSADVIVYDLFNNVKETINGLKVVVREPYETDKVFIGISTIMSWAKSKILTEEGEEDPEAKLSEANLDKRRPHPHFKPYVTTENLILAKGNSKREELKTYVIWPGLLYGGGEAIFHSLFKRAWLCEATELLCPGDGKNKVPTIHVKDLGQIILSLMNSKPDEPQAIIAVDQNTTPLKQIVAGLSKTLGPGKVRKVEMDEYIDALAQEDRDMNNYNMMLQVDLAIESTTVDGFGIERTCPEGLIGGESDPEGGIKTVVAEYREANHLTPVRIFLHGPPAVGKSTYAQKLAYEFEILHLKPEDVIQEILAADPKFKAKVEGKMQNGRIPDDMMVKIYQRKLSSYPCQNQGYILDGFPKTLAQAKKLFRAEKGEEGEPEPEEAEPEDDDGGDEPEPEPEVGEDGEPSDEFLGRGLSWKQREKPVPLPEFCVSLEATDDLLRERILQLQETAVKSNHNSEEGFNRRLDFFKNENKQENTVVNIFEENGSRVLIVDAGSDMEETLEILRLTIGMPHNYQPNKAKEEREKLAATKEAEAVAEGERQKQEALMKDNEERQKRQKEESVRTAEIRRQEQELLEARSQPLRKYLMENVLPILTKGLLDVAKVRPEDPIDFLADYLFQQDFRAA